MNENKKNTFSSQRRAFTIVEIIVLIGILILTLSILDPALNRGRESAKKTICSSNLHQIGLAIGSYAYDHDDLIPPFNAGSGLRYRLPNQSYVAYDKKLAGPDPWNLALIYKLNYVDDASIFYCPSQTHQDHIYDTYSKPWGLKAPEGKSYIFAGYSYNPYVNPHDELNLYKCLSTMPKEKILLMDLPAAWSTAHLQESNWEWNILYPDQHIELHKNSKISSYINSVPKLSTDWSAFNKLVKLLENDIDVNNKNLNSF